LRATFAFVQALGTQMRAHREPRSMIGTASAIARATDFVVQVELGKTHAANVALLQWHCTEQLNFEI
jgi:hypothetical protein